MEILENSTAYEMFQFCTQTANGGKMHSFQKEQRFKLAAIVNLLPFSRSAVNFDLQLHVDVM